MSGEAMIRQAICTVFEGRDLCPDCAERVMQEIVTGPASNAQIGAFLTALEVKGPSVDEISAFVKVMKTCAVKVNIPHDSMLLDTCGTGGDGSRSFNISTAAAFIAAGAGVPVVKHGNRNVSGMCGSADVLESLGVNVKTIPSRNIEIVRETGIGFFYAPLYHPAIGRVTAARREIGIRTVFNLLGPLSNPVGADAQLLGVYHPSLTTVFARVLQQSGVQRAMVVHGAGLDEVTTTGETIVSELSEGVITEKRIRCTDFGIPCADLSDIAGGGAEENAKILMEIFEGEKGPHRDIALLNGAAAIYTAGRAGTIREGVGIAMESVDSGAALGKLNLLIGASGA